MGRHFVITLTSSVFDASRGGAGLSAHGYYGVEGATVDAIVRWMLGSPYPTQVEWRRRI